MKVFLQWALDSRSRISTQLYTAFGGAVALTVITGMVGWYFIERVEEAQRRVNENSVPSLVAAFGVAQQSGALAVAAPRLAAATTQLELTYIGNSIEERRMAFNVQLSALAGPGHEETEFERIRMQGRSLTGNIAEVEDLMWEHVILVERREALSEMAAALYRELAGVLLPAIDDQLFFAMTGRREFDQPPVPRDQHFSETEFNRYRLLARMHSNAVIAFELLASVFSISDASLIEPSRERLEASLSGIEQDLSALPPGPLHDTLERIFGDLAELGIAPGGHIDVRARKLELNKSRDDLLSLNQGLAIELVDNVEGLVQTARASAGASASASHEVTLAGRNVLLGLSALSIAGAMLISWLFVGRMLVRRLAWLSARMRRMAGGDLEEEITVRGNDEIADMSSALEVFRRHALEVQRLNLVEKLAEELQGKNQQIEAALADLQKAQDQIVMSEKLAALGELTAGVAHEIRNPLNFVKNFAEGSAELLEELMEELQAMIGEGNDEEDEETRERRALIAEINNDLLENIKTIQQHGTRADNIVQSMLMMGRGSGERQLTDVNALVDEHLRLAYHSARAADPNFRLELVVDMDPEVGELDIIPQDLGRVFLNLANNACYATDEKRQTMDAERTAHPERVDDTPRYDPELRITSKNLGDSIEICVRDNGNGILPEVADKIFNPFFTTKPANKGTGLGLALSNDIVREHGGEIRVETQSGEYTEMIVRLPRHSVLSSHSEDAQTP